LGDRRAPISEWLALDLTPTQLKLLELVQDGFHLLLMGAGSAPADPVPALHQKFLPRPVGFEVEGGNDPVPDQNWANEIAKYPLVLGNVSFEATLVIEEEPESLSLNDQRVEGGQDIKDSDKSQIIRCCEKTALTQWLWRLSICYPTKIFSSRLTYPMY
jgi:hypothetical protein